MAWRSFSCVSAQSTGYAGSPQVQKNPGHPPIERQIDATDRRIDNLVYELYGLTDEDIRIVEEATQG